MVLQQKNRLGISISQNLLKLKTDITLEVSVENMNTIQISSYYYLNLCVNISLPS